ncbi:hypothetical protein [Capybara microvirus Cap1_SP_166]|nr:hypothetical protein [Capybara microvirus Cap1_SP_166]
MIERKNEVFLLDICSYKVYYSFVATIFILRCFMLVKVIITCARCGHRSNRKIRLGDYLMVRHDRQCSKCLSTDFDIFIESFMEV